MNPTALFGASALLSFVGSSTLATLYVWPRLRVMDREQALAVLIAPHVVLRFVGMSLLVPGVVSPSLPHAFAVPAAYGDVAAGLLAIAASLALRMRVRWATLLVWLFSVWGAADLLFAGARGVLAGMAPGALGAAFYIPTAIAPFLLVSHLLTFGLLVRRTGQGAATEGLGSAIPHAR